MKRVYTDPRFPGFEVHNDGDNFFHVYQIDNGERREIDTFSTFSGGQPLAAEVAERRARDYFDRMGRHRGMSAEFAQREQDQRQIDHNVPIQMKNSAPAPDAPYGLSASKDLDSFMGDNIMTSDDVIAAYERAKTIPDAAQREAALAQVRSMSQQLESAGSAFVRNLLD